MRKRNTPPIEARERAASEWTNAWNPEVHETDYAAKRIKSARSAKLTPIKVDYDDLYGYFQGRSGRYETFLDRCPCGDFRRGKVPCKHIYRLAMELGVLDADFSSNSAAIITPKTDRASLDDTIDIVESLSDDAQAQLKRIANGYTSEHPNVTVYNVSAATHELIESGLVVDVGGGEIREVAFGLKASITSLLEKHEVPFKKSAKKADLEALCLENIRDATIEEFGENVTMDVAISSRYSAQNIYRYLHRKLDSHDYFDIDGGYKHGSLLDDNLPDDNVTDQLIKRGYYARK